MYNEYIQFGIQHVYWLLFYKLEIMCCYIKCLNAVMGHVSKSENVTMKVVISESVSCPVLLSA